MSGDPEISIPAGRPSVCERVVSTARPVIRSFRIVQPKQEAARNTVLQQAELLSDYGTEAIAP